MNRAARPERKMGEYSQRALLNWNLATIWVAMLEAVVRTKCGARTMLSERMDLNEKELPVGFGAYAREWARFTAYPWG